MKLDVDYFRKELTMLLNTLDNRSPEELTRYLRRLADVADPKEIVDLEENDFVLASEEDCNKEIDSIDKGPDV